MAIECTVDHNDTVANDAGIEPLIGWVTASVETRPGNYRVRDLGGPTPSALKLLPRRGWLAPDGHMYKDQALGDPFRIVANDPAFNLRELTYRFDFDLTTLAGVPVSIPFCRGPAPSSDTTLYLARLMNDLDQPVIEVRTKGYAQDLLDSGATGISSLRAVTQADGRTAIDAPARADLDATMVNLHLRSDVAAAQWQTFLGAGITSSSTAVTGTPWTSADVGKVAMFLLDSTADTWFRTTITGAASIADAAPITKTGVRVRYGFDGTATINNALAAVSANINGPVDVMLGGSYRLSQLVIPWNVRLHGVGWGANNANQRGANSATTLAQLPGSQKDFVVFQGDGTGWLGFCGLTDMVVWGPEKNVSGLSAPTTGNGVAFALPDGTPQYIEDGFQMERVTVNNFPQSGFRSYGVVPFYFNQCKALFNGRYGFEHNRSGGASTNALHIQNFSGDWNNLGLIYLGNLKDSDTVFITGVKSEGNISGAETDTSYYSGPGYQSNCIVLDSCDVNSAVLINGVSHIRVARANTAPGPAITISGSTVPKVIYNAVMVRLLGTETGSTASAVTLRDSVGSVDIPRTVTAGTYPFGTAPPSLVDNLGHRFIRFNGYAGAATAFFDLYNAPNFPILAAADLTQNNVSIALQPKGAGVVYIDGSSPSIQAGTSAGNKSLNLIPRGTGTVQYNGNTVATLLTEAVKKTASYTANANEIVPADATSGAVTITFPTAPVEGSRVVVKKVDSSSNPVNLILGGSDVFNIAGGANTGSLTLQNQAIQAQYDAAHAIWYVISTDVPLSGLDARYVPAGGSTGTVLAVSSLEVGNATDTTISRVSAGIIAVEGVAIPTVTDTINVNDVTTGQETLSREIITSSSNPSTNGVERYTFFTAKKSQTITQIAVPTGGTAGVGATLCRIGLYTVDGSGNITLVASTANDTTLWIAANTLYTKALSSSYAVTRGTRYAIGLLVVGSTTAPTFMGCGVGAAAVFAAAPQLAANTGGNTDLQSSVAAGGLTSTAARYYAVLLP